MSASKRQRSLVLAAMCVALATVVSAPPELAHRAHEALPAALALADRLGPQGATLAAQAQAAFVDGLGVAMLIAASTVAAAAVFVFWRARETVAPSDGERALDRRVIQSLERV